MELSEKCLTSSFFLSNLISLGYFLSTPILGMSPLFSSSNPTFYFPGHPRSTLSFLAWKTNCIYYLRIYFTSPTFGVERRGKGEIVIEKLLRLVYFLLLYLYFILVLILLLQCR